eukprot:tig00000042_g15548.t1
MLDSAFGFVKKDITEKTGRGLRTALRSGPLTGRHSASQAVRIRRIVSYSPLSRHGDDGVCALAALCGPGLRRLNLFWSKEVTGLGLRAVADRGPPLCALNLGGVRCIMDEDLGYMLQRCCAGLLELRLFRCGWLTRPGLEAVAACPRLSLLVLSGCRGLDPADLARIPALVPTLMALHVSYCRLSDEAARAIGTGLPLLQVLNVSGTDVTDAGLDWGTPAEGGYALRELHARRCGLLRGAGLAALLGRCPRLALLDAGLNRRLDAAGALAALAALAARRPRCAPSTSPRARRPSPRPPRGRRGRRRRRAAPTLQSLALEDVRTPPRFAPPPRSSTSYPPPAAVPVGDGRVRRCGGRAPPAPHPPRPHRLPGGGGRGGGGGGGVLPAARGADPRPLRVPPAAGVTGGPPFGPFGPADPFGDPSAPAAASADLAPALRALLASCPRLRSLSLAFRRVGPSPAPPGRRPPRGPPLALELLNASGALGDLGAALDARRMPRLRVAKLFRPAARAARALAPVPPPPPRPGARARTRPRLSLPALARLAAACPRLLSAVFGRERRFHSAARPFPSPRPSARPALTRPAPQDGGGEVLGLEAAARRLEAAAPGVQWLLARFEPDSRERVGGATAIGPDAFV